MKRCTSFRPPQLPSKFIPVHQLTFHPTVHSLNSILKPLLITYMEKQAFFPKVADVLRAGRPRIYSHQGQIFSLHQDVHWLWEPVAPVDYIGLRGPSHWDKAAEAWKWSLTSHLVPRFRCVEIYKIELRHPGSIIFTFKSETLSFSALF
jgi:hypothetical protein